MKTTIAWHYRKAISLARKRGWAGGLGREEEGTACKDAIVFFVFYVHQTNVKILIGQIL